MSGHGIDETGQASAVCRAAEDESSQANDLPVFEILPPAQHPQWDAFVLSEGNGTLFHTAWWYRAWSMEPAVRVLRNREGAIVAGMCCAVGRRFGQRAVIRPPMTPCNGPVFACGNQPSRHSGYTHVKKMLLTAIHSLPRLGMYDFVLRPADRDVMPFLWNGFDTLVGYTYVLRRADAETWMQQASKTERRYVRRAVREATEKGFAFDEQPPLDDVLPMLQEAAEFKQYSMKHYAQHLPSWWQRVAEHGAGRAYLLRDGKGLPAAAALMVYDRRRAYYLAGGMRRDLRKGSLVNVLLMHRMIDCAHGMGLDFDFEGSVLPGVEKYVRGFGGELEPIFRVVKLPSLAAYLVWHAYRYWTGHRKRTWIWHD